MIREKSFVDSKQYFWGLGGNGGELNRSRGRADVEKALTPLIIFGDGDGDAPESATRYEKANETTMMPHLLYIHVYIF